VGASFVFFTTIQQNKINELICFVMVCHQKQRRPAQ
jgi:hypothetical protein